MIKFLYMNSTITSFTRFTIQNSHSYLKKDIWDKQSYNLNEIILVQSNGSMHQSEKEKIRDCDLDVTYDQTFN